MATNDQNNISEYTKMLRIRDIYKDLGLRFDVRSARKFLDLPKNTPRTLVNQQLRQVWKAAQASIPKVYLYKISGTSTGVKNKVRQPAVPITISFYSKDPLGRIKKKGYEVGEEVGGNGDAGDMWTSQGEGSDRINTITDVKITQVPANSKKLNQIAMFNATILSADPRCNSFQDTGNMMCVPETVLHHLKKKGRNVKLNLDKVIAALEEASAFNHDLHVTFKYDEEGDPELPEDYERGKQGFTADDIAEVLKKYRCAYRMLDSDMKQFMSWPPHGERQGKLVDKNLTVFCGIVSNGHLYYSDDKQLIASLAGTRDNVGINESVTYKKKEKNKKDEIPKIGVATDDLTSYFEESFKEDNQFRFVSVLDGKITRISYPDKIVYANPDLEICKRLTNEECIGITQIAKDDYEFPEANSTFSKDVFDIIEPHGNIVGSVNKPLTENDKLIAPLYEFDINKCRTACWKNNQLGPYEIFDVTCVPEPYTTLANPGWYYCKPATHEWFMRGNTWYSQQFILEGKKRGYNTNITHFMKCASTLPADHFKKHVEAMIKKYPFDFKSIVNRQIGCCGKTKDCKIKGWLEADYDMAVAAFWANNKNNIGMIEGKRFSKSRWMQMDEQIPMITQRNIAGVDMWLVEIARNKTKYTNQLPIYNKVLENEYLRLHDMIKNVGGRLIKIKTDAIIVQKLKLKHVILNHEIGGYKMDTVTEMPKWVNRYPNTNSLKWDKKVEWNVVKETTDGLPPMPKTSFLVTGMAGFGKSHVLKNMPEFDEETTIRTAFTNCATENISDDDHIANTLHSCFGIDVESGCVSESKLRNLKNCKTIMISECFMIPSNIMHLLSLIKSKFPEIRFICEGDPHQTRPIGQEHINWYDEFVFNQLCDGQEVRLTINRRNNETKNYNRILEGDDMKEKHMTRPPQSINITKTNRMRKEINNQMMDRKGMYVPADTEEPYSQDMWLTKDTPIMAIKNCKKHKLKNGKMYKIDSLDKDTITVNDVAYNKTQFAYYFVVAYACTNHKIQGLTISVPFNIYEWQKMDTRERYTAYSRTRSGDVAILK